MAAHWLGSLLFSCFSRRQIVPIHLPRQLHTKITTYSDCRKWKKIFPLHPIFKTFYEKDFFIAVGRLWCATVSSE